MTDSGAVRWGVVSTARINDKLLAVNFYKRGDLFRLVDTFNGTG